MALEPWVIPGVFALNLVLGVGLVLGLYAVVERQGRFDEAGAAAGIVGGTALVYAEATLGERMFTVTVGEMKLLVLAATVGAVVGVVGAVVTVEPEA